MVAKLQTVETTELTADRKGVVTSKIKAQGFIGLPLDVMPEESIQAELVSLDVLNGPKLPTGGLNLMYGVRNTVVEMSQFNLAARRSGHQLCTYEVTFRVQRDSENALVLSDLPLVNYLHLQRLAQDTRDLVEQYWRKFLADDGYSKKQINTGINWRHMTFVASHPHYIDRLQETEEFKHIDLFVYPVTYSAGQTFRAALYNSKIVESIHVDRFAGLKPILPKLPNG